MAFAEPTLVRESFVGEDTNAAPINAVLGGRDGPVETAAAPAEKARDLLCVTAAWVNPAADDVYEGNRASVRGAIQAAVRELPADPLYEAGR